MEVLSSLRRTFAAVERFAERHSRSSRLLGNLDVFRIFFPSFVSDRLHFLSLLNFTNYRSYSPSFKEFFQILTEKL